ncbi:MAG: NAD(P)-dependent malic enzyme [Myxococcota bacterium]
MGSREELEARAGRPAEEALRLHAFYRGKVQTAAKCPIRGYEDFAVWYTPGVAAPSRDIHAHREAVWEHTNRGNTVAVVSDGSRVLGLGDIGPEAALPVMEGKALLFKYLGGVDAVPLCLDARDPDALVETVERMQPCFGGIHLEDIAQPKCFRILDALRSRLDIPVWHDDQQGTATVVLAALSNALKLVGRDSSRVRVAMIGAGAANVSTWRLLTASGVDPEAIVACDSVGTLHPGRRDIEERREIFPDKWRICLESNGDRVVGSIPEALRGADVCIAFSAPGPGVIRPEWIRRMAGDPIVLSCANPTPEIWPWEAQEAGARIVATGRSDMPNQVNNSLGFPGIFRGALDVRARTITDEMARAAAGALASWAERRGLRDDALLPRMDDWEVYPEVAVATAMEAQRQGVARLDRSVEDVRTGATAHIRQARIATEALMDAGAIPPRP